MKLKWIGSLLILAGVVGCKTPDRPNLVEYVNPNIGTVHSRWFFYTPAAEPFGMAKLGASTNGTYGNNQGWEAIGYEDNHTSIDGFPCLHEFQIGGISLMPVTGEVKQIPENWKTPIKGSVPVLIRKMKRRVRDITLYYFPVFAYPELLQIKPHDHQPIPEIRHHVPYHPQLHQNIIR